MTSFFNKKLSLVLLVLASLMIFASVSSVSAAIDGNATGDTGYNITLKADWSTDNPNLDSNGVVKRNDKLYVTGNATNIGANTGNPFGVPQGNLSYRFASGGAAIPITSYSQLDGTFSFEIDTSSLPAGWNAIFLTFTNSTLASGPVDSWQFGPGNDALDFNVYDVPALQFIVPGNSAKVGVPTEVTVRLRSGATGPYILAAGNGTYDIGNGPITIPNGFDVNGTAIFNVTFTSVAQRLLVTFDGNNTANLTATNDTWSGVPGQGTISNFSAWFTSNEGYVVGETATIGWFINTTLYDVTDKYVIIVFTDNGKFQWSFTALASAMNTTYTWKKAHDNLTMTVYLPGDANYAQAVAVNSTFVDQNSTRRTTLNVTAPAAGTTLKVGVLGTITVQVLDFRGFAINQGTVLIQFDNYDPFTVDINNSIATFDHVYLKAGAARALQVTYLGDIDNRASFWNTTVNVAKGDANVSVLMIPPTTIVGHTNIITTVVKGLAVAPSKTLSITLKFMDNGKLQHSVSVPLTVDNTLGEGTAIFNYAFKKPHANLQIVAELVGTDDYNTATGSFDTIVNAA